MKSFILMICFFILATSCSPKKLTIDEKFDWNLDFKSLINIFPPKDDTSELEKSGKVIFSSEKTIRAFPHKGVVIEYSKDSKVENITFKEMNQIELLNNFIEKEGNFPYKCTEPGNRVIKYKIGTIHIGKNQLDFKFRLDTSNNSGYLTIYRPENYQGNVEIKRLLNNPVIQCNLDY